MSARGLDRKDVAVVLSEFRYFKWTSDLHGFRLQGFPEQRLKHGGGIAGRGGVWWMERIDGSDMSRRVQTRKELRRLIRDWLAESSEGQKPLDRIDADGWLLTAYPKLHAFAGNENYVWIYRRKRPFACCGGNDEQPPSHCMDCTAHPGRKANAAEIRALRRGAAR
jgi:hypothetical protein